MLAYRVDVDWVRSRLTPMSAPSGSGAERRRPSQHGSDALLGAA